MREPLPSQIGDRVAAGVANRTDERQLRAAVVAELRRGIGFDAYAWLLTDPETAVGSSPLAEVPSLSELPRLIRLKYCTDVNRWTRLPHDRAVSLRDATGGVLAGSLVWRELLRGYDVVDVLSAVFRDHFGTWGFLDLWRTAPAAPFGAVETAALGSVLAPVTAAIRACHARTFAAAHRPAPLPREPVVLLLADDLQVTGRTRGTDAYLRQLLPSADDGPPVPAGAYNVGAQLHAREAGVDSCPAHARVHLGGGHWITMSAARLRDDASGPAGIAVTMQEATAAERAALLARACGLTPRERDVLALVVAGADTRGLARRLLLSEHTVQDHLKAVFAKTSTSSRRELVARVVGAGRNGPPA